MADLVGIFCWGDRGSKPWCVGIQNKDAVRVHPQDILTMSPEPIRRGNKMDNFYEQEKNLFTATGLSCLLGRRVLLFFHSDI